jgi:hypothetical protein
LLENFYKVTPRCPRMKLHWGSKVDVYFYEAVRSQEVIYQFQLYYI